MCCAVLLLLHRLAYGQILSIAAIAQPVNINRELSSPLLIKFTCIVLPGLVSCPHATISVGVLQQ
jgi:hypothetical protein